MNFSTNKYDTIEYLIFSENLKINAVEFDFDSDKMILEITSGEKLIFIVTSISNYEKLKTAKEADLKNYKLISDNTGIHWPDLDEDLSLKGFLKEYLVQMVHTKNELVIA